MAGRIRSIKPEILENDRTARLTNGAWRLFVSMITLADDFGNLGAAPERLHGAAFWGTPDHVDVRSLLDELEHAQLVVRYTVHGRQFVHLTGWKDHQRLDNAKRKKVPGFDERDGEFPKSSEKFGEPPKNSAGGEGRGEDWMGGGDPPAEPASPPAESQQGFSLVAQEPDPPPRTDMGKPPSKRAKVEVDRWEPQAREVLDALNTARKRLSPTTRGIWPAYATLDGIAGMLESGRSVEDCLHVIAVLEAECRVKPESLKFLDHESPFRPKNFERYLVRNPADARAGPAHIGHARPSQNIPDETYDATDEL